MYIFLLYFKLSKYEMKLNNVSCQLKCIYVCIHICIGMYIYYLAYGTKCIIYNLF